MQRFIHIRRSWWIFEHTFPKPDRDAGRKGGGVRSIRPVEEYRACRIRTDHGNRIPTKLYWDGAYRDSAGPGLPLTRLEGPSFLIGVSWIGESVRIRLHEKRVLHITWMAASGGLLRFWCRRFAASGDSHGLPTASPFRLCSSTLYGVEVHHPEQYGQVPNSTITTVTANKNNPMRSSHSRKWRD